MWAPDPDRRSALGLATLMIVGAVAGFIVAEPAASRDYQTVETVGDDAQAYAVDLGEEKRLRFVLEVDQAQSPDSPPPEAAFSVYDPADDHFASFDLSGDGDAATVLADRAGAWVLFVQETERGDLAVQVEGEDHQPDVRSLEVRERSWQVAEGDGGPVDADLALRMDRRPAQAYLDVDGHAEDLDAEAASEEGLVHAYRDVDSTRDGRLVNGSQQVRPDNLAAGTYEVAAEAATLNGTVELVAESYERVEEPEAQPSSRNASVDENATNATRPGTTVASLDEGEASLVDPQGAATLAFEVPSEADARVYVYDASDDLVGNVLVEDDRDDGDRDQPARATFDLAADEPHAVYVKDIDAYHHDDEADVDVRLPSVDEADPATNLSVVEDEVVVEDQENGTASFNVTGGLVAIGAQAHGWTWDEGDVTVEGPLGVVLESGSDDGFDGWWGSDHETYPERFSDGTFQVTAENDDGFGFGDDDTTVRYASFVR